MMYHSIHSINQASLPDTADFTLSAHSDSHDLTATDSRSFLPSFVMIEWMLNVLIWTPPNTVIAIMTPAESKHETRLH